MHDLDLEQQKDLWQSKAYTCCFEPTDNPSDDSCHDWMVISWLKTKSAEHASVLMCKRCFHTINIDEMYKYR